MPNATRLFKNALLFRSMEWARAIQDVPIRFTKAHAVDPSKGIYVPEADVFITGKSKLDFVLLENTDSVARAKQDLGAVFTQTDGKWIATFKGLSFQLNNKADVWLLTEVFLDGTYHMECEPPPSAIIDIGMNAGVASLYLAHRYDCEIHSYELCSPTFESAERNMALNPELAKRVTRNCFGLADKNDRFEIDYVDDNTVVTSMYDLGPASGGRKLPVEVRKASEVLGPIIDANAGRVFAKIDCEGAEFPILRDLESSGHLSKMHSIVMEWHRNAGDPQELVDILVRSGFTVFSQTWVDELGFLRASRSTPYDRN